MDNIMNLESHLGIGKALVEIIKGEDFFSEVDWNNIVNSYYEIMADNFLVNVKHFLNFLDYQTGKIDELSDSAYIHLKNVVEGSLTNFGYYWNDEDERYRRIKDLNTLRILLHQNNIEYEIRDTKELSISNRETFLMKYVNVVNKQSNKESKVLITFSGTDYVIHHGEWFEKDSDLIAYLKSEIETKEEIEMNTLDLTYVGLNDTGLHVVECNKPLKFTAKITGIDFNLLANKLYCKKHEDANCIHSLQCGNGLIDAKDFTVWIDTDAIELSKALDKILPTVVIPTNYVKVNDKYYEVNNLEEFLELEDSLFVEELNLDILELEHKFDNNLLEEVFDEFSTCSILSTIDNIKEGVKVCHGNIELYEALLNESYSFGMINDSDLWISNEIIEDASKDFIEEHFNFDSELRDYIDYYEMFTNEIEYNEIHGYIIVEI